MRRLVIIDGPDSWAKELADEKIVEKFYGIDFTDESTIFDRCLAKIKEAEKANSLQPHVYPSQYISDTYPLICKVHAKTQHSELVLMMWTLRLVCSPHT